MKKIGKEESKGEKRITEYLNEHGFFHLSKQYLSGEKPFPSEADGYKGYYLKRQLLYLDGGRKAYPDFEVLMGPYHCSIEFDGEEHFRPIDFFGGPSRFVETHFADTEKDSYWESEESPHLRIRYNQYDEIEERLDDFLSHPENYVTKHSREDWDHYYDEWKNNFFLILQSQESNPEKRFIIERLGENSILYYFAEIKQNGKRVYETIINV